MVEFAKSFKSIQRRLHNIEYTKTQLPDGFEDTEEKYRKLRDIIGIYKANIEDFMNYEHGGKTLKTIKEGLNTLGTKIKEDYFKSKSIYSQAAVCLGNMATHNGNQEKIRKYSEVMQELEKVKCKLNESLEEAKVALQRLEKDAESIDAKRIEVKNKRYDLERLMKNPGEDESMVNNSKNRFDSLVQSVLVSMNAFIGSKGVGEIAKKVMKAHHEFFRTSSEKMRDI